MSRFEVTGERSLTYSQWHRTLPDACQMIDVDGLECCDRRDCREPLLLVETCCDTSREKPTTILRALARKADVPALLIRVVEDPEAVARRDWAHAIIRFRVKRLYPVFDRGYKPLTPDQLASYFVKIHADHLHKRHSQYRPSERFVA